MTSFLTDSSATMDFKPLYWRELWNTTLSYLVWGYGALLLSFISYGAYTSFKWMARSPHIFALVLAALFTLRLVIAFYREFREISGALRKTAYEVTETVPAEWIILLMIGVRVLALVLLSWKLTITPAELQYRRRAQS